MEVPGVRSKLLGGFSEKKCTKRGGGLGKNLFVGGRGRHRKLNGFCYKTEKCTYEQKFINTIIVIQVSDKNIGLLKNVYLKGGGDTVFT